MSVQQVQPDVMRLRRTHRMFAASIQRAPRNTALQL